MDVQEYLKVVKVEALVALRQDPHKDALDDWSYEILREIAVRHTSVADLSEEERAAHQARIWAALINAFTLGYAAGRSSHKG